MIALEEGREASDVRARRGRPSARRPSAAVAGHIGGLDGVRAFAVLAVIAFHLWPRRVPGGFLGVDVFFVISGFLITTLLLREGNRTGAHRSDRVLDPPGPPAPPRPASSWS